MRLIFILISILLTMHVNAEQSYLIDWDEIGEESIAHLVELIKIDTTNPPGKETEVVSYLESMLAVEGIESQRYALEDDRANLVARLPGNGSKRPILIMGHTDVVGVQADKWSEDPFSGVRKDGYIYGRGALDDKDNVAAGS